MKLSGRKFRKIKDWIKFGLAIACVVVFIVFFIFNVWSPIRKPVSVVVPRGASVTGMTNYLYKNHIIKSKDLFYFSIRLNGGKIQAGEYDIPRGSGIWTVASMLAKGKIATTTITIPEGLTVIQIKNMLMNTQYLTGEVDCDKDLPVCDLHDGDIFPDTYRIARGTRRLDVLELARKKMIEIKESFAGAKYPEPLKTWEEVLVLASIVQKETPQKREMPIVASVYLNRLNINMRLQADPTVVYALTDSEGDMHGAPLLSGHLKIDSPYNTYVNNGLPPHPIANVGRDAIRGVLKPAHTKYLFFVADGRGGHKFSKDYAEHQKHHESWRRIKKEKNSSLR
ncbi:MAG: endolytic transglycosylase MltG [Alphaproteobacteria bacterium]|nr:endolytic transglycosylase MltG [Alphaproteobacteria bacterium]